VYSNFYNAMVGILAEASFLIDSVGITPPYWVGSVPA
jgi:hypothetical protein